jgi:hypothetical protein
VCVHLPQATSFFVRALVEMLPGVSFVAGGGYLTPHVTVCINSEDGVFNGSLRLPHWADTFGGRCLDVYLPYVPYTSCTLLACVPNGVHSFVCLSQWTLLLRTWMHG